VVAKELHYSYREKALFVLNVLHVVGLGEVKPWKEFKDVVVL